MQPPSQPGWVIAMQCSHCLWHLWHLWHRVETWPVLGRLEHQGPCVVSPQMKALNQGQGCVLYLGSTALQKETFCPTASWVNCIFVITWFSMFPTVCRWHCGLIASINSILAIPHNLQCHQTAEKTWQKMKYYTLMGESRLQGTFINSPLRGTVLGISHSVFCLKNIHCWD